MAPTWSASSVVPGRHQCAWMPYYVKRGLFTFHNSQRVEVTRDGPENLLASGLNAAAFFGVSHCSCNIFWSYVTPSFTRYTKLENCRFSR
jgi:hypothetical protein